MWPIIAATPAAINSLSACTAADGSGFGTKLLNILYSASKIILTYALNTYNVHMNGLHFEWDEKKEKANIKKHGVSFDEARTAFYDENAIQFFDPDHSVRSGPFHPTRDEFQAADSRCLSLFPRK